MITRAITGTHTNFVAVFANLEAFSSRFDYGSLTETQY